MLLPVRAASQGREGEGSMIVAYAALTVATVGLLLGGVVFDRDGLLIASLSTAAFTAGLLAGEVL